MRDLFEAAEYRAQHIILNAAEIRENIKAADRAA